jgi:hypothetical protein
MVRLSISCSLLGVVRIAVMVGGAIAVAALPALAGSTGNGAAGGGFSQYTYETDANRLCKGDTVVWGSSANKGVYFLKSDGPYYGGKRIGGFYACMGDVKKAGYKIE